MRPGGGGLALEGADLPADLADQVTQAFEVLRRGGQPALGPLGLLARLRFEISAHVRLGLSACQLQGLRLRLLGASE